MAEEQKETKHPYFRYGIPGGMLGFLGYSSLTSIIDSMQKSKIILDTKLNNPLGLSEEVIKQLTDSYYFSLYGGLALTMATVGLGAGLLYEIIHKK